tara:strand:+ start:917 stop:1219 length:303 start_codon:yes stop_codon:yes gene_type:complete
MSDTKKKLKDIAKPKLNSPSRITKGEPGYSRKKFKVFVNDGGDVKKVMFGDPNMEIKRDDDKSRENFRARHNCDNPGPKTKARYWSCKMWEKGKTVTELT